MDSSDDDQPFNIRDGFSEESDEDSLRPNKRRKTKGSTLRTRGLTFQKSNQDEHEHEDDEEDLDDDRPTMGMGFGMANPGFGLGQFQPEERSPSPDMGDSPEPAKPAGGGQSAFGKGGKVNQNSFAARMMAKMGHVEGKGLGRAGQGIAAPIQAQKVQVGTGLGFGQAETSTKKVKDKEKLPGKIRSGTSTPRLKAPPKKKYEVNAIESRGLQIPQSLKNIIDATGAETKRLDNLSGYSTPTSETARATTEEEKKQARLKRDLQLFADAWDGQLHEAEILQQELENREAERTHSISQAEVFEDLATSFERVAVDDSQTPREFDQVVLRLQGIQQKYSDYIEPLDLPELAVAALSAPFQRAIVDWEDPLVEPGSQLTEQLQTISPLLELEKSIQSRHRKTTTSFESLLLKSFYPHIRQVLRDDWIVFDAVGAKALIDQWYPSIMPAWMLYKLLEEVILPRLIEAVKKFKAPRDGHRKRHAMPDLHEWLFDWWILFESSSLGLESFTQLKIEIKSKVRFDDRVWSKWEPLLGTRHKPTKSPAVYTPTVETPPAVTVEDEMSFKDIFEEWCIENDLTLRSTGAADGLGRRLLRLMPAGKTGGGVLIYLQDDVVFESSTGDPYMLDEELVARAKSG